MSVQVSAKISLIITTCKRCKHFLQLIKTLYDNCSDIDIINEVIIIDDNSNMKDKHEMLGIYKSNIYFKNSFAISMY